MAVDTFDGTPLVSLPVHSTGWETIGSVTTLYRSGDKCIGAAADNQANRRTETYADKHYSKIDLLEQNGGGGGPAVRCQANGDFYSIYADESATAYPFEMVGGSSTDWEVSGIAVASGPKTIELRVNATTSTSIDLWVNGSLVKTYTGKNALSGGKPGVYAYGNPFFDNFDGGDVASGAVSSPPQPRNPMRMIVF